MTILEPLYDPSTGQMRVAGLISGTGSNLVKIIEHEHALSQEPGKSPFHVAVVFTDTTESNAGQIGQDYDIPVLAIGIRRFYERRGKKRKNLRRLKDKLDLDPEDKKLKAKYEEQLGIREEFDRDLIHQLGLFDVHVAAFAGYMSIATEPLISALLGVNVHPADLSSRDKQGRRRYVGDHAVRDAILAGEKRICSSTHLIEEKVDYGRLLMRSGPMEVVLPEGFDPTNEAMLQSAEKENQGNLKKVGDWLIFPATLENIARGRFAQDETGLFYFDKKPIPDGYRL